MPSMPRHPYAHDLYPPANALVSLLLNGVCQGARRSKPIAGAETGNPLLRRGSLESLVERLSGNWRCSLLLVALLLLTGPLSALEASEVYDKVQAARSSVEELHSTAVFTFQLRLGFLPYKERLNGEYTFQAPDSHNLTFPNAPSYLANVPQVFNWNLPSLENYRSSLRGPLILDGREVILLTLVPKSAESRTRSMRLTVDAKSWEVLDQATDYKDGGFVHLRFSYLKDAPHQLVENVAAELQLPSYSLKGTAFLALDNHRVNGEYLSGVTRNSAPRVKP